MSQVGESESVGKDFSKGLLLLSRRGIYSAFWEDVSVKDEPSSSASLFPSLYRVSLCRGVIIGQCYKLFDGKIVWGLAL